MSYRKAELLLVVVIVARATSLLIIKACLGAFSTFNLMALRFGVAFFCLISFVWKRLGKRNRSVLARGGVLGAAFFATVAVELQGLRMTDSAPSRDAGGVGGHPASRRCVQQHRDGLAAVGPALYSQRKGLRVLRPQSACHLCDGLAVSG